MVSLSRCRTQQLGHNMRIILVSRSNKAPRTHDLSRPRTRLALAGLSLGAVLLLGGAGAGVALLISRTGARAEAQVQRLHAAVMQQQQQLAAMKAAAQRNINGLAVKLGELQAQSVRLNALGERLAKADKLGGDGEFDFTQPPAIGGPESTHETSYALPRSLQSGIAALSKQFNAQSTRLNALSDVLLDRHVRSSLRPTGMPVHGYISSYFGPRIDPFTGREGFHPGLDIAVPVGTPVRAVAEGIVTFAGVRRGYGKVVEVDDGDGYMTRFAHNSKLLVHPGERVHIGQVLAKSGDTGRSTGPHVHFEVWHDDHLQNPLAYVRAHRKKPGKQGNP